MSYSLVGDQTGRDLANGAKGRVGEVVSESKLHWKGYGQQKRTQLFMEAGGKWWDKEGIQLM
jgi:hypothetical protein